jgi:hypothetical protein
MKFFGWQPSSYAMHRIKKIERSRGHLEVEVRLEFVCDGATRGSSRKALKM